MKRDAYARLENYMRACVYDRAHDENHVMRVLYNALEIARTEPQADRDVVIAACLLHDIARREEAETPGVRHAEEGARKARAFLQQEGFDALFCERVAACIAAHSFGGRRAPESVEERILFDADKLDATGAVGTLRMLLYHGRAGDPIYLVDEAGHVSDGKGDAVCNYFYEYHGMIARVEESMLTAQGRKMAAQRARTARQMYAFALEETRDCHETGYRRLQESLI